MNFGTGHAQGTIFGTGARPGYDFWYGGTPRGTHRTVTQIFPRIIVRIQGHAQDSNFGTGARPGANISFLARGHAQDNDFSTGARPGAQAECMRAPTEQINKIIEIYC